jgi:hypothetical protein
LFACAGDTAADGAGVAAGATGEADGAAVVPLAPAAAAIAGVSDGGGFVSFGRTPASPVGAAATPAAPPTAVGSLAERDVPSLASGGGGDDELRDMTITASSTSAAPRATPPEISARFDGLAKTRRPNERSSYVSSSS